MRIAVDARPLHHPRTGIGRYLSGILNAIERPQPELTMLGFPSRNGGLPRLVGVCVAFTTYGLRSRWLNADVFWSPRHHLPAGLGNIPAVVTIHDLVWKRVPETMEPGRRSLERMLMAHAVRATQKIIAVSAATRNDLIDVFPEAEDKVAVVHPGTTFRPIPLPTTANDRPFILFVGTLEPRKNLNRVLDAFERARDRGLSDHELIIVGGGGWKNRSLKQRLADSPASSRIKVLGQVSDHALAELYSSADFLLAPSLYEGFGMQILEAMAMGIPVITSNVSSMPEVCGDAGLLVDPNQTDEIEEAILRLAIDRELHARLAATAHHEAERFSWDRAASRTVELLTAVSLARGRRH